MYSPYFTLPLTSDLENASPFSLLNFKVSDWPTDYFILLKLHNLEIHAKSRH